MKITKKIKDFQLMAMFGLFLTIGFAATANDIQVEKVNMNDIKMHYCVGSNPNDQFMIENPNIKEMCQFRGFFDRKI